MAAKPTDEIAAKKKKQENELTRMSCLYRVWPMHPDLNSVVIGTRKGHAMYAQIGEVVATERNIEKSTIKITIQWIGFDTKVYTSDKFFSKAEDGVDYKRDPKENYCILVNKQLQKERIAKSKN